MNSETREWYNVIKQYKDSANEFLNTTLGMLLGMLNAASILLGLLPSNYRMDQNSMKVNTLRSSDDSMTIYLAND